MSESGFEIVEHTADVGIRGWAPDLSSLFREMALGLFEIITDPATVSPVLTRRLELDADSPEALLHEWLEELNALHQVQHEVYSGFDPKVEGTRVLAEIRGDKIDPKRHDLRVEVKAITWHDLSLKSVPSGFEAYVLLDI